jgi:hypothetical protein
VIRFLPVRQVDERLDLSGAQGVVAPGCRGFLTSAGVR